MLYLVHPMNTPDDQIVQEVFDNAVKTDKDRLIRLVEQNFAYGVTLEQLCGNRVQVSRRTPELVEELVSEGTFVKFVYSTSTLYFHLNHVAREPATRETFQLVAA